MTEDERDTARSIMEQYSKPVSIRLPPYLRRWIEHMAEVERRSLNNQITVLLEDKFRELEPDLPQGIFHDLDLYSYYQKRGGRGE